MESKDEAAASGFGQVLARAVNECDGNFRG